MFSDPPNLPRSWKHRYTFRLGTTSFIYPAGYRENVARLGPYLDEIELLMFESQPASRPTHELVDDLRQLGEAQAVTYNVHLPTDLALTHPDESLRRRSCRILKTFVTMLTPLTPTVYVLHLPPPDKIQCGGDLLAWQRRAGKSLENILENGLPPRRLAMENLFFPFEWLTPLVEAFDLGVCLDIGHLVLQEADLEEFLKNYGRRIAIAHLHGLWEGKDHGPLGGLPPAYQRLLADWLGGFKGTVSLEVFAYESLLASLSCLDGWMSSVDGTVRPGESAGKGRG
jgi:sugar phosphate isomerase/epimerase